MSNAKVRARRRRRAQTAAAKRSNLKMDLLEIMLAAPRSISDDSCDATTYMLTLLSRLRVEPDYSLGAYV